MINTVKDNIYSFFKTEMATAFPNVFPLEQDGFSEKIYWKKTRDEEPQKPYIVLNDVIKGKLNKACEVYRRYGDKKLIKRENWMMQVTFSVYTQNIENLATAERDASDYIEYITDLFNSPETFETLSNNGIIINEKQMSDIRDLSSFEQTNYSFRYEVDVVFEFDIIKKPQDYGKGEAVKFNINTKDTNLYTEKEITGD